LPVLGGQAGSAADNPHRFLNLTNLQVRVAKVQGTEGISIDI
jgi:hypothetical protein